MKAATMPRSLRLPASYIRDAREVLPKDLLVKLQRHCSGLVYVPAQRKENDRRERVLRACKENLSRAFGEPSDHDICHG